MTILVDARFDDYPGPDGSSSGCVNTGCTPIWLIQAPGNGGSDMSGASYPNGAPADPNTGISHVTPVSDPAGSGKRVYRMVLDGNQTLLTGGYLRTEFTFHTGNNDNDNAAAAHMPNLNSSDYWYWTSFYLPTDWSPGGPVVIMQLHDSTEAPSTVDPNLILTTCEYENSFKSSARLNSLYFRKANSSVDGENPATLGNMVRSHCGGFTSLPLGRWVEVVVRARAGSTAAVGLTQIWIDRRLTFSETKQNSYGGKLYGHSLHVGLYGYWGKTQNSGWTIGRATLYTKGAAIGDQNHANFNAFMTALGWASKTELEPAGPRVSV